MITKIPYALDSKKQLIHIDQVQNGYKCDCICPACGSKLNARNGGETRVHHFAHISSDECFGAGETILHLLAKNILSEADEIILPNEKHQDTVMQPERTFKISVVELERRVDDFIPDALLISDSGEELFIEVKVTHGVDETKLMKIKQAKINCIEIDLHGFEKRLFDQDLADNLKKKLLQSPNDYTWLHSIALQRFTETKHDFKFMVKKTLFDKDTFLQISYNERLTWKSSLDLIWINNGYKPFIAGTWYKGRYYTYYFIEDPRIQKSRYGCVYGYKCEVIGDSCVTVHDHWEQVFYYKCEVVEDLKNSIFNPFEKIWYFAQDYPDEIIDEATYKQKKAALEEKQRQKQEQDMKREEYNQEMNRRAELIQSSTQLEQFNVIPTNPFPRTASELLKVYGDTTKVLVTNRETGEVMSVAEALKCSLDYPDNRIKRVWSYYDQVN